MKGVLAPTDARARGNHSRWAPGVLGCAVTMSAQSWTRSSCCVPAVPSCASGQGEQLERGRCKLLLWDLQHLVRILTCLPKLTSPCAAKTFLLSFNPSLLLFCATSKDKGMTLEINPEVRTGLWVISFWGILLPFWEAAIPGEKQVLILSRSSRKTQATGVLKRGKKKKGKIVWAISNKGDRYHSYSHYTQQGKVESKIINKTKLLILLHHQPKSVLGRSWNSVPEDWGETGLPAACWFLITTNTLEGVPASAWASRICLITHRTTLLPPVIDMK